MVRVGAPVEAAARCSSSAPERPGSAISVPGVHAHNTARNRDRSRRGRNRSTPVRHHSRSLRHLHRKCHSPQGEQQNEMQFPHGRPLPVVRAGAPLAPFEGPERKSLFEPPPQWYLRGALRLGRRRAPAIGMRAPKASELRASCKARCLMASASRSWWLGEDLAAKMPKIAAITRSTPSRISVA
jgi:hypothetical protein